MAWQSVTVLAGKPTKALELNTVQANITAQADGDAGAPKNKLASMDTDSVDQAQIISDAVHTDELKTVNIDATSDPGGTGIKSVGIALDTSEEAFLPLIKMIDNGGTGSAVSMVMFDTAATTFNRRNTFELRESGGLGATNTPGVTVRVPKVDSSPPWDIGDGEIPFFLYAEIDSSGRAVSVWSSSNPPWDVYTSAENIIKRRLTDDEVYKKYGVEASEIGQGRKYKLQRTIANKSTGEIKDNIVEIDKELKNKHMESLSNPFKDWVSTDENENIISKKTTIILIDPCETLSLLEMAEGGFDINDMVIGKNKDVPKLKISNDFLGNRETPHKDIKIMPLKWK